MATDRVRSVRLAAYLNVALGALTLASIWLAQNKMAVAWSAGFVGAGLLVWGSVEVWAAGSERLRGTKLLAIFMAMLGVVLAGTAYFVADSPLYLSAAILLGVMIVAVNLANAFMGRDEDRRGSFEPRRPDDIARPPSHP